MALCFINELAINSQYVWCQFKLVQNLLSNTVIENFDPHSRCKKDHSLMSLTDRRYSAPDNKLPRLDIQTTVLVGSLLFIFLIGIFILFSTQAYVAFERSASVKINHVLEVLEATHTASMLNRGHNEDGNPVIRALDDALVHLSENRKNMSVWLVMGPKVLDFQKKSNRQTEPPHDAIDEEAVKTGLPVARFADKSIYRISKPVILGRGIANNPKML